jgi:hypothetical protein
MSKNPYIDTVDALFDIQELLKKNNLLHECENQFEIIGQYVGDNAPTVKVDNYNGPPRPRGRPARIKK